MIVGPLGQGDLPFKGLLFSSSRTLKGEYNLTIVLIGSKIKMICSAMKYELMLYAMNDRYMIWMTMKWWLWNDTYDICIKLLLLAFDSMRCCDMCVSYNMYF